MPILHIKMNSLTRESRASVWGLSYWDRIAVKRQRYATTKPFLSNAASLSRKITNFVYFRPNCCCYGNLATPRASRTAYVCAAHSTSTELVSRLIHGTWRVTWGTLATSRPRRAAADQLVVSPGDVTAPQPLYCCVVVSLGARWSRVLF